jgi:hypothetical protein
LRTVDRRGSFSNGSGSICRRRGVPGW